jgi:hypothetical protein
MEKLLEFRETLQFYRAPANGKRDPVTKRGQDGPGPLTIESRRELLAKVDEYSEKHRPVGLQQELLEILQDDFREGASELTAVA